MLAYVFEGEGKLTLKDVPKPKAKNDSVVIKVNACSICGTDFRTYIFGSKSITPQTVIGHEVSGTIIEAGCDVISFHIGERVAVAPAIGCSKCNLCLNGHSNMCDDLKTIGFQYNGGFAEYMEIPASAFVMGNVNKLKDTITDEEAALAEPIACVTNAQEFLNIKKGDNVAIFGSGFIGCMHAELAFNSGAAKVIMIEIQKNRSDEALRLVDKIEMINPATDDVEKRINEITSGKGVDVAIVACSSGKAQQQALNIVAKRGRVSLFGGIVGESKGFIDSNKIHYKELSVYGVHASTPLQNYKILNLISDKKLDVKKYITRVYSLNNIVQAFEAIKNENIMKAIIKP